VEPTTFFGMTGAERVQAVFSACDVSGLTPDELCKRVAVIEAMPAKYAEKAKTDMQERVLQVWNHDIPGALSKIETEWKDNAKATKDWLARKTAELGAVSTITREAPAFDGTRYAVLQKTYETLLTQMQPSETIIAEKEILDELCNDLEAAETSVDVAQRELDDLDELAACPRCKASAKGWKHEVESGLKRDLEQARHKRESLAKQFKECEEKAYAARSVEVTRINLVEESIKNFRAEIAALEISRAERASWQQTIGKRDALETDVMKLTAEVECYRKGREIVTELREKVVEQTFGKVLAVARNFTDGLLNSPIEMEAGALGRRVSEADNEQGNTAPVGSWIPHEAFSGTEQLLAYAGFAVALAQNAPIKLVIMDELGRLTLNRKVALLKRMCELVQRGVIDQFVGCDVEAVEVEGVNVIVL
jgi:hypothetical protein